MWDENAHILLSLFFRFVFLRSPFCFRKYRLFARLPHRALHFLLPSSLLTARKNLPPIFFVTHIPVLENGFRPKNFFQFLNEFFRFNSVRDYKMDRTYGRDRRVTLRISKNRFSSLILLYFLNFQNEEFYFWGSMGLFQSCNLLK